MCIGGPALVYYVSPTEEELFKVSPYLHPSPLNSPHSASVITFLQRFNPELQTRSVENRAGRQEDISRFVEKLKEYSRSNKTSEFAFCWRPPYILVMSCDFGAFIIGLG